MRNIIFGTLLAASTALAIGATSAAKAMSVNAATVRTEQANPLVENVYWVRTYYYRPYVYLRTCGWVPTVYGPVRVCN